MGTGRVSAGQRRAGERLRHGGPKNWWMAIALVVTLALHDPLAAQGYPGDVFSSSGGGPYGGPHPSRPTGKQATRDDSVYCQQTPDGRIVPKPYQGTGRQIPCGLPGAAAQGRPREQPAPATLPICNLRDLARVVYWRYKSAGHPIASYRVTRGFPADRNTYLVVAQGIDSLVDFNATKANTPIEALRDASGIASAYADNLKQVIDRLDRGPSGLPPRILLAGHSHGGMAAQSVVYTASRGTLTSKGAEMAEIVTYGAPMTLFRNGPTHYVQVAAEGDSVIDLLDLFFRSGMFNGPLKLPGVIRIPGGADAGASHSIYPNSVPLTRYDLWGEPIVNGRQPYCWYIDPASQREYSSPTWVRAQRTKGTSQGGGCASIPLRGPASIWDPWNDPQHPERAGEKFELTRTWSSAQAVYKQNDFSELVGMKGMRYVAAERNYRTIYTQRDKAPIGNNGPAFGIDGYFLDRATNTLVFGEAKGGGGTLPAMQPVQYLERNQILGRAYSGCIQGTLGWVKDSLNATARSTSKDYNEVQAAKYALNWIEQGKPTRVEVFYTQHAQGYPGKTSLLVTDNSP